MAYSLSRHGRLNLAANMKTNHLLVTLIAVIFPLTAIVAQDSGKVETSDQKQQQSADTMKMKCMGKGPMMSNWKDQDVELDKLVAEMNSAPADKKLDAVAALLTKLVEQHKTMHEQMQKMMSTDGKQAMNMCRMMMGMEMKGEH
jgi:hypothetical protein